jgi:hypothetical protein
MKHAFAISVFCSSLIFFFAYLMVIISTPIILFASRDLTAYLVPLLSGMFPVFLGIVSFTGTLYAIRELGKNSERWYLAVPFAISVGILCISNPIDLARGGHNLEFFYLSQVLATITSPGFFLSFPDLNRNLTRYFAAFSGVVGIFNIYHTSTLVPLLLSPHGSSDALFVGLIALSWLFLMPAVGACFIATAFQVREKALPVLQQP